MSSHATLSIDAGHRSYLRGCRCRHCRKAHAAHALEYRRSQERSRTNPTRTSEANEDGQLSLLGTTASGGSVDLAASAISRGNDDLPTPTRPKAGLHHSEANRNELRGALDVAPTSGSKRGRYLLALVDAGARGLTDHEASLLLGMPVSSINGRRNELRKNRDGSFLAFPWVKDSGRERKGSFNSYNTVWVATQRAQRWAATHREYAS